MSLDEKNQNDNIHNELINSYEIEYFFSNKPINRFQNSNESASKLDLLNVLKEKILNIENCELKKNSKQIVFSNGNSNSEIMIVGEGPGQKEDEQGKPFVGQAGQLLNKMLAAINLQREDVYITNVIPWRPPNNRTPTNEEILQCLPYLQKHIEIIKPNFLLLLGATAAKAILSTPLSISKLRNKWHIYNSFNLSIKIKTLVSYHPAFLLRSPASKKEAWKDLQFLQKDMNNDTK